MHEIIVIDEDGEVTEPLEFGANRDCCWCREAMDATCFTTSWRWHMHYCSPACRDLSVLGAIEDHARDRRRARRDRKRFLERIAKYRCLTAPRPMFVHSGYRFWRHAGKPPESVCRRWRVAKLRGRWVAYHSVRGAIDRSCSCSEICEGRLRPPFRIGGELFVCMGGCNTDFKIAVRAWKVLPVEEFEGPTYTYNEKLAIPHSDDNGCTGEYCRRDPMGFYHGMTARFGKQAVVLQGPPVYILPGAEESRPAKQKSLF